MIVLLGALAVVAALAAPRRKGAGHPADSSAVQMQTALEQFMENMEADNREIADSIAGMQKRSREENAARDERIAALERRAAELENMLARTERRLEERIDGMRSGSAVQPNVSVPGGEPADGVEPDGAQAEERKDPTIRQRYPELFALHDQGKPVDAIARKIGMNKGEVMLILQLASREDERHV